MSETRTYGGTWKSQRSRKQSAATRKLQGKNSNTPKPASSGNVQNHEHG